MRDHDAWIDFAVLDSIEQRTHVTVHRSLTSTNRQSSIHQSPHGELVDQATIHANDRNDATVPARHDRLTQRDRPIPLESHRLFHPTIRELETLRMGLHTHGI